MLPIPLAATALLFLGNTRTNMSVFRAQDSDFYRSVKLSCCNHTLLAIRMCGYLKWNQPIGLDVYCTTLADDVMVKWRQSKSSASANPSYIILKWARSALHDLRHWVWGLVAL